MMTTFTFYFGCSLGERLLKQTDNLSRALQDSSTLAAQGNRLSQDVIKTLSKDRSDTSFDLFWDRILLRKTTEVQDNEDPKLPRKRKASMRQLEIEEQNTPYFPQTPENPIANKSILLRYTMQLSASLHDLTKRISRSTKTSRSSF